MKNKKNSSISEVFLDSLGPIFKWNKKHKTSLLFSMEHGGFLRKDGSKMVQHAHSLKERAQGLQEEVQREPDANIRLKIQNEISNNYKLSTAIITDSSYCDPLILNDGVPTRLNLMDKNSVQKYIQAFESCSDKSDLYWQGICGPVLKNIFKYFHSTKTVLIEDDFDAREPSIFRKIESKKVINHPVNDCAPIISDQHAVAPYDSILKIEKPISTRRLDQEAVDLQLHFPSYVIGEPPQLKREAFVTNNNQTYDFKAEYLIANNGFFIPDAKHHDLRFRSVNISAKQNPDTYIKLKRVMDICQELYNSNVFTPNYEMNLPWTETNDTITIDLIFKGVTSRNISSRMRSKINCELHEVMSSPWTPRMFDVTFQVRCYEWHQKNTIRLEANIKYVEFIDQMVNYAF